VSGHYYERRDTGGLRLGDHAIANPLRVRLDLRDQLAERAAAREDLGERGGAAEIDRDLRAY
jgi:hypothetical protein